MSNPSLPLWSDWAKVLPQYLLPHHLISRCVLRATRVRVVWFKNLLIRWVINAYNVDMSEALSPDINAYQHFNHFFTRSLKPEVRPFDSRANRVLSPADGRISAMGYLNDSLLLQAKGHEYSLQQLLGGDVELADKFRGGAFTTIYLSPRDYHRYHMPLAGRLRQMLYVPGRLFSVNPASVRRVRHLFARNERVIALFDTQAGPMAVIPVGALNVACIETVWHGVVTPPHRQPVHRWVYDRQDDIIQLDKGAELGRFNMGSTVILLFPKDALHWDDAFNIGDSVRMGQGLGSLTGATG
ncbi:MAG: phosphatidylserine decarboxylase [Gammaproteobacteria bacterium]|nr:phosphatidylserine decarboxylase [Gammaproteobacteria bacterium]